MMMRAVQCKSWGGPQGLVLEQMAVPEPGPGQVRIAVHAAGVNFADTLMIAGKYQERPEFPFVPGLEAAGEIDAVGKGVIGIKEGDRVMAILGHGAFAERALAPAEAVFHIPKTMDAMTAANVLPLWDRYKRLNTREPQHHDPMLWPWATMSQLVDRAARDVSMAEAERRVLLLAHPAFEGTIFTTPTLSGGLQILEPGESAHAHRHTLSALRLAMIGDGVVTIVDGNTQPVTLKSLTRNERPDPRFFNFPDGSAGVLLERTGEFYRIAEVR